MSREEVVAIARFLAVVGGRSHARQMNASEKKESKATMSRRSKSLEAPGWLWSSAVDLISTHEAAYLEHCRRYALSSSAA
jgi:uncharacterized protein (DUF2252 family)